MRDLQERKINPLEGDIPWGLYFCGIKMSSNYFTFHQMSRLLDENPKIEQIVELGTFTASMTMYLGLEGIRKNIPVKTFNLHKQTSEETDRVLDHLKVEQRFFDIYAERDKLFPILSSKTTYLICDAGQKSWDAIMSFPHMKSGSIMSIHDWGVEVFEDDVKLMLNSGKVTKIRPEEWNKTNVQLANFRIL